MHGGQQTGYHRISGISSHLLRARGSYIKVLIISMLPSTAIYNPPLRLSEQSRRELKRMYPTTGAATNSQSSLGVLLLLRQSPPDYLILKVSARAEKSVPLTGATTNFQSSEVIIILLVKCKK